MSLLALLGIYTAYKGAEEASDVIASSVSKATAPFRKELKRARDLQASSVDAVDYVTQLLGVKVDPQAVACGRGEHSPIDNDAEPGDKARCYYCGAKFKVRSA